MYKVYEAIGNFSNAVFESDLFNEVVDYLQLRFDESDETDEELFFSYFTVEHE